jgi:hypothetical protein
MPAMSAHRIEVAMIVNGEKTRETVEIRGILVVFLREDSGLTAGTKKDRRSLNCGSLGRCSERRQRRPGAVRGTIGGSAAYAGSNFRGARRGLIDFEQDNDERNTTDSKQH